MGTLKGKNAFVTGTSQGIGAAIAETLVKAGCNICMHYYSSDEEPKKLQKIAEENNQKAICVRGDLTQEADVVKCVKAGIDFLGSFDILVNNSGSLVKRSFIPEITLDYWKTLIDLAKDPTKTYQSPKVKEEVPYLNFSSMENAMVQLKSSAEELQKQYVSATRLSVEKQKELNEILFKVERSLINENGLPRRSWYKHQIYAPGYYTGYGVKTLPGIREAIEQRNWKEAQENIEIVSKTMEAYTQQVQHAVNIFK